ncbi:hypothetical protein [Amycolatopsis sp. WQ 127309]|uniref:hypothetical protein n=1 Tax=Amycolatopsis sp. WQ 127309 TaxID=2932773 RepID=UPI001FF1E217|nr:hypothetical protein [Amycolatopsis sp. WQ 127309]UOZ08197.1 hypothetical protein MUY22_07975 [Amycolatopsis sp. WQ 127309]
MSKENAATSETKEAKSGLRIAQVMAAALAAVTAALLGSTLGVAGTVAGAGVASVITTVGGEVYLRSLQRTRAAASKARQLATSGIRRRGGAEVPLAEQPTVRLKRPDDLPTDGPDDEPGRLRKLRWPLIIGTSVVAFAVAILAMVSVDAATGGKVAGGTGAGIGKIFGSGSGPSTPTPSTTPSTSTNDTQDSPTDTSPTTTQSNTPPTTSSDTPTTTPTTPSTTSQKPTTSAAPPTSQGAASTPTP